MFGLYRTFKENYVPYFADGTGRDRYIAYNNAGFLHNFPKSVTPENSYRTGTFFGTKIVQHNRSPSIKSPNFHYHSDGNGRDTYILINGGGLFTDSKPLLSYRLTDFLRKHDYQYTRPINRTKVALSRAEIKYNKYLRDKEKEIVTRLYTNEKKKFMKKPKFDPFRGFSSEEFKKETEMDNKNKTTNYFMPKYKFKENDNNDTHTNQCITEKKEDFNNNFTNNNYEDVNTFNKSNKNNNIYQSSSKANTIRFKPRMIIDANSNNMKGSTRAFEKTCCKTENNFYNSVGKIKNYQIQQNKKLLKNQKQPYFHVLNDQYIEDKKGNQNEMA